MGTLFDYLEWRGDISFSSLGICEVDNMIFSQICYIDFDKIVRKTPTAKPVPFLAAAKKYMQLHKGESGLGVIVPAEIISLTAKAARSLRFSETKLISYVNHISDSEQKQFSALTFLVGEDTCFVAFRGTDDTIVGWKESLNLSFLSPIPAQIEATSYLESIAAAFPDRKIYVGGHSKGGNLAVWASVKCSEKIRSRIVAVYNNDGPGFDSDFIQSEPYREMKSRIHTLVPQSSVVGMLLEHEEAFEVVQSKQTGIFQHNGFSWNVRGGSFIHKDAVTKESRTIDTTLKKWLSEITPERRREILDSLYETLTANNATTLTDLASEKVRLIKSYGNLDPDAKSFIKKCVTLILKNSKSKDTSGK